MLQAYWTKSVSSLLLAGLLLTSCSSGNRIEAFAKSLGEVEYILPTTCDNRLGWSYYDNVNGVNYLRIERSQCVYEYEIKTLNNGTFLVKEFDMDNLDENLYFYYDGKDYYIIGEKGKKLDYNETMKKLFKVN